MYTVLEVVFLISLKMDQKSKFFSLRGFICLGHLRFEHYPEHMKLLG